MAEKNENKKCSKSLCLNKGKFKCSRCLDLYCSLECQMQDWQTHRYVCFPMPELIPIADNLNDIFDELQDLPTKNIINTTIDCQQNIKEKRELQEITINEIKGFDEPEQLPTIFEGRKDEEREKESENFSNTALIVEDISKNGRKNIVSSENEESNHKHQLQQTETKEMPFINAELMSHATFSTIIDSDSSGEQDQIIENEIFEEDKIEKDENFIASPIKCEKIEEENKENVPYFFEDGILKRFDSNDETPLILPKMNSRKALFYDSDECVTSPKSHKNIMHKKYPTSKKRNNDPFELIDLKRHEWSKSKNINVKMLSMIQSKVICFCENKVVIEEFYNYVKKEVASYQLSVKDIYQSYLPKKNEIVIGEYDGNWYRACVIDPAEDGVIVQLIDYGSLHILKTNQVLPICEKLSFEICARDFIIDNIPNELSDKQCDILISESMMITNIYQDENNIYHCEIFGF